MTGSAKNSIIIDNLNINIFIRSVNHKILDINFACNKDIKEYEEDLYKSIYFYIKRGHIYCCIEINDISASAFVFNETKILSLVKNYENLTKKHSFFAKLVNFSDVISLCENNQLNKVTQEQYEKINELLLIVVKELYEAKIKEGLLLLTTISELLYNINNNALAIKSAVNKDLSAKVIYLKSKMLEILKNESNILDEQRMYQEAALLAQRSDFTEEIERLLAHIKHFDEICSNKELKGRKLDFICQEMLREVNTLLSKASANDIIKIAIDTKSYVENLREQIQNIE